MYYNHMVLSDYTNVYPCYMDKPAKLALKQRLEREKLSMYCGCSIFSPEKLEYGVSTDGKVYPLHQGYEHSAVCARAGGEKRKTSFVTKEDGTATAFLNFNIREFSVPQIVDETEEMEEAQIPELEEPLEAGENEEAEETEKDPVKSDKEEKEPLDSLGKFILQLNNDTIKERIMAGKSLLSADYFLNALGARCKKIYIDGINKSLRELTLDEDAMQFFYQPLTGIEIDDRINLVLQGWKSPYRAFVFEGTFKKEQKIFEKRYGISLQEALAGKFKVMAAGFRYLRLSRRETLYKVVGRLHFFLVNENGLYCRSMDELEELNAISAYLQSNYRYKHIRFERVIDDDRIIGIFSKSGKKQIIVCKPKVPKNIAMMGSHHMAFGTGDEKLSTEHLRRIDDLLCGK